MLKKDNNGNIDASELFSAVYAIRLLVFVEETPQSNHYHQLMLDDKQFKELTTCISRLFPCEHGRDKHSDLEVGDACHTLPDLMQINNAKGK